MSKKKKNPVINFVVNLHVYPFDVMVSINQTDPQLADSLKPYEGHLVERDYENCKYGNEQCVGRAVTLSNNASLLRLRKLPTKPYDFGNLAHEIFHIVSFVMERIGMKLEVMVSDEAYAYLTEYLTKEIYTKLNKYY